MRYCLTMQEVMDYENYSNSKELLALSFQCP